ncbi:SDR family NAD(P)-dependent oxidoreductase [Solwaraspora sp. WMMA2080]|uniref:SDR family NAD(P)-dependent oxidoreductase n=1 Tax=unclassified Solwaraspora TaxID=2627926 RepID=UPI00248B82D8|nr:MULTISPECIES: SDR family NAD(P)-dependent oxidoreductase [unclassified Solwaraspora]WBB95488.1 SDR family NAD(P)-dependent oxidoreductase [Solwaraspora sp. WMMA2059]WBC20607.1 SDR family NAD(P)-dependent oxidoreductase [Solwaraspora sp. WMMA2080]
METGLLNKVALVTGASGAIGRAAARHLAAEGAAVAVSWHTNRAAAMEVVDAIAQAGGDACAVGLDHGDLAAVQGVVEQITTRPGPISVLIANAVQWPASGGRELVR